MSYFIRIKGKPFGPFDDNQLQDMKTRGRLNPTTEVSSDRVHWQPASTLEFLYQPPPVPPQPTQNTPFQNAMPPRIPSKSTEPGIWFYSFDGENGYGPVTQSAIIKMLQSGELTGQSYVWKEGQTAVFLQAVPEFSSFCNAPHFGDGTRTTTIIQGTFWNPGDIWQPLERSLGWLMFLKITWLSVWILYGLCFVFGIIFMMSRAVSSDSVSTFLITIIVISLELGYYYLMFRPFLALWKYHTVLQKAAISRQDTELAVANRHLFQLWKDLGIFLIVTLTIASLAAVFVVVAAGVDAGMMERVYNNL